MNLGNGTGVGDLGGSQDFASRMLAQLGLGGGGARNAQSVSAANNASIQVSPTFVQSYGGSPTVAPSVGGVTGTPTSSASASSAGTDPSRAYSPSTLYRTTPTGYPTYDPLNSLGGDYGGGDMTLPLLLGAGALLFLLNE